jgi:dTDP-4-dehydrorhamnose 3,5-epimerase
MSIKTLVGNISIDDRGSVRFVNDFDFSNVKRFYQVENHSINYIRAWHGHMNEGKYVYVSKGSALIGAVELSTHEIYKTILSDKAPKVLWIPPGYANGFMNLENDTSILFFSTATLEQSKNDDIRFAFDKWDIWKPDYR